ncbi:MAG: late competence development ComFB family protein [Desulfosporosinus sp.]|nr:late competence development ComFB family protein [Desulfosporosinus sp.]
MSSIHTSKELENIRYEIKNYSEIVVHQALQDYLRDNKISCYCDRCQADIIALSLNRLPPHYYVSSYGELMLKYESDPVHVMAVLLSAIQQVSDKASHS